MPPARFEPAVPAIERPQKHALSWVHTCNVPRTVTPYRDSVDWTRDHVTYQTLVTR
jgi:hypothetical protein